mmetsp:Transcript_491/g.698  ORF Transcript_491/g.698 Transcript_491/m.698 type:complete len:458 (-) Transcript_491:79-1452(-)
MQTENLGFIVNDCTLQDLMRGDTEQTKATPTFFADFSLAVRQLYQEKYAVSEAIQQEREYVRAGVEALVAQSGVFPPGTRVSIFGSSANGFGSPSSDIDMCLQIPPAHKLDEDDATGSQAMEKLATFFESAEVKNVDVSRLSARIPIVKFNFPRTKIDDPDKTHIECDLCMQNPLALLNTTLLRSYADISPAARIMASIVKRWAVSRDINNPAKHSLSSYGYIIMLLHFLTSHCVTKEGTIGPYLQNVGAPMVPSLQWMDLEWARSPPGIPYMELPQKPNKKMPHPTEANYFVNPYFCHIPNRESVAHMQNKLADLQSSVGLLLLAFFRFYAFEFDYKSHVVSLNATLRRGPMSREVKAEHDAWRLYSSILSVEDPFETFYDVAHVVKAGSHHRIRKEFALAFTKLADASTNNMGQWDNKKFTSGQEFIDWICEPLLQSTNNEEDSGPTTTNTTTST